MSLEDYISMLSIFGGKGIPVAICHYPEDIMRYVIPALGLPDEVLAWVYPSNVARQFRLVNIYGKKPNFSRSKQEYKNKTDKRIRERIAEGHGAASYDWREIDLVKNVSKGSKAHPCPVPVKLMEWIIEMMTEPRDTVYDPFIGGGSTMEACLNLGRNYIGTEKSSYFIDLCEQRRSEIPHKNPSKIY
jgi:DNA modification methylase